MKIKKYLPTIIINLSCLCGLAIVWFSTSIIQADEKTYEVQPQITLPEYRTDTARAIDAYERLMERYMGLTESNLIRIRLDTQNIAKKLDIIDSRLTKLSIRIARIEAALGIEEPKLEKKPPSGKPVKSIKANDHKKPDF